MMPLALLGLGLAFFAFGGGRARARAPRLSALDRELVRFATAQGLGGSTDAQRRERAMTQIVELIDTTPDDALEAEAASAASAGYREIARFMRDAIATRQSQRGTR